LSGGGGDGFDIRTFAAGLHAGTALPAHRHGWGQLVFAASGVMQVLTEDVAWTVPPTRAIWVPAGVRHAIAARGEVAMRTLYIDRPRADPLPARPRVIAVAPLLRELILHILDMGMLDPRRPAHDRLAGLLIDLLLQAPAEDLALPLPRDPRALRLAEAWRDDPGEARDLIQAAKAAGASLRTLQRLFPRETGLTLEGWRQKARLVHAVVRLSAGASVTQAALDCGYQSQAAFNEAFVRQLGVTPGRFKR